MAGMSAKKRLAKPLLFGSLLCALATAFVYRRSFFPEIEELRSQEYQHYEKKRQEVLQRRQQQLAELPQKRSAS
ncbi:hypothetical protein JD844_011558 [Phrynosoma platyrhinos]|uniref:Uncharacterized protein n=1 Tax=Phrynosoma platyrhinos TaxID=52577 RepID=A0ABQ7TIA3_PHRPL|nr:hypothetical protein JD844_011558 [Phrynosoma platyrhinos]